MARRVKPYFLPELWMMMGGRRLAMARDESRLGEESREEGLDEREWGEMGLIRVLPLKSSASGRSRLSLGKPCGSRHPAG